MNEPRFESGSDRSHGAQRGGERDFDVEEDLLPAVALLTRAAPANGLNLVPRWESFLADRMAEASRPAERTDGPEREQRGARRVGFARIATALLLGIGFGAAGAVGAGVIQALSAGAPIGANAPAPAPAPGSVPSPHYSAEQQSLMFALLDRTAAPSAQLVQVAAVELSGCVACHERLSSDRFSSGRP